MRKLRQQDIDKNKQKQTQHNTTKMILALEPNALYLSLSPHCHSSSVALSKSKALWATISSGPTSGDHEGDRRGSLPPLSWESYKLCIIWNIKDLPKASRPEGTKARTRIWPSWHLIGSPFPRLWNSISIFKVTTQMEAPALCFSKAQLLLDGKHPAPRGFIKARTSWLF